MGILSTVFILCREEDFSDFSVDMDVDAGLDIEIIPFILK